MKKLIFVEFSTLVSTAGCKGPADQVDKVRLKNLINIQYYEVENKKLAMNICK